MSANANFLLIFVIDDVFELNSKNIAETRFELEVAGYFLLRFYCTYFDLDSEICF